VEKHNKALAAKDKEIKDIENTRIIEKEISLNQSLKELR
jgi:hypothetical protein